MKTLKEIIAEADEALRNKDIERAKQSGDDMAYLFAIGVVKDYSFAEIREQLSLLGYSMDKLSKMERTDDQDKDWLKELFEED